MSFLYFVPTGGHLSEIEYAFDGTPNDRDVIGEGPGDGRSGKIYGDRSIEVTRLGYFKDRQTWRKIPGTKCRVGWCNDSVPTLDETTRPHEIPGKEVDGALIPVSRSWNEEGKYIVELPCYVDVNDEGEPIRGEVIERCRSAWDLSQSIFERMMSGEDFSEAEVIKFAWQILALNYRVGPVECSVMKLIQQGSGISIIKTFLELDQLEEVQKKTQPGISSFEDGSEAETHSTVLAQ